MKNSWKKAIMGMGCIMLTVMSAVQATADGFFDIPIDRVFDEDRTLYYVEVSGKSVYDLEADGYTQIKKASAAAENGIYTSENVTVLKNDSTGKEYRFVFTVKSDDSGVEITNAQVSSDGKLSVSGICTTDKKLYALISMPKENFGDVAYSYEGIDKANMERYVIDTVEIKQTESAEEQSLFEYQFPQNASCGTYKVMIIGNDADAECDIYYLSQSEIDRIVEEFNDAAEKEANDANVKAMREYTENNSKALYLELEYYNQLSDSTKNTVAKLMMSREGEYTHADIKPEFIKSIAVAWVNDGKSIDSIVKAYPNDIKFEMLEKYSALKNKSLVDNSIKSARNYADLENTLNSMTALSMLNEAEPDKIGGILKDYRQYLVSDKAYDYYFKNESSCLRKITNKNFGSTDELEKAILSEDSNTDSGKTSGGSKSNGGKSSGVITAPSTTTVVIPETRPMDNKLPFADLENYQWAYTAIEHLYNNNICSGKDDKTFAPKDNILREEAAKLIVNAFGIELKEDIELNFNDVPNDSWYAEFIKAAMTGKVVTGISENEFGTGTSITRQDLAVMLYRAINASGRTIDIIIDNKAVLDDLDEVSEYAREAVDYLVEIGAVKGSDGRFRPNDCITRAEAAQMIYSVIKIR